MSVRQRSATYFPPDQAPRFSRRIYPHCKACTGVPGMVDKEVIDSCNWKVTPQSGLHRRYLHRGKPLLRHLLSSLTCFIPAEDCSESNPGQALTAGDETVSLTLTKGYSVKNTGREPRLVYDLLSHGMVTISPSRAEAHEKRRALLTCPF